MYDARTGWLLTGDNLYPGRLYVKNWNDYTSSIRRLVEFSTTHRFSAVMGTPIGAFQRVLGRILKWIGVR